MRSGRRRLGATSNPLIVLQWIIAIFTIIGGAYTLSPFLQLSISLHGKTPFLQTAGSSVGLWVFGVVFTLSGLIMIAGIMMRKVGWRSKGLFLNGLARLYVIFGTILAQGVLPLTWMSNAAIAVIVFYIWGRIRKRGIE